MERPTPCRTRRGDFCGSAGVIFNSGRAGGVGGWRGRRGLGGQGVHGGAGGHDCHAQGFGGGGAVGTAGVFVADRGDLWIGRGDWVGAGRRRAVAGGPAVGRRAAVPGEVCALSGSAVAGGVLWQCDRGVVRPVAAFAGGPAGGGFLVPRRCGAGLAQSRASGRDGGPIGAVCRRGGVVFGECDAGIGHARRGVCGSTGAGACGVRLEAAGALAGAAAVCRPATGGAMGVGCDWRADVRGAGGGVVVGVGAFCACGGGPN